MRTAQMKVTNTYPNSGSVIITLHWFWLGLGQSLGTWHCLPGYLKASSGYWEDKPLENKIRLFDDDDNKVAWTMKMDVDWTGYPFTDLKVRDRTFHNRVRRGHRRAANLGTALGLVCRT